MSEEEIKAALSISVEDVYDYLYGDAIKVELLWHGEVISTDFVSKEIPK